MKRIIPMMCILLTYNAIVGCRSNATGPAIAATDSMIFPLALGNNWVYREQYLLPNGRPDTTAGLGVTGSHTTMVSITHRSFLDGDWQYSIDDGTVVYDGPMVTYFNRSDGLWYRQSSNGFDTSALIIPFPVSNVGVPLEQTRTPRIVFDTVKRINRQDTEVFTFTCVSRDTVVTVAAGTFHCYEYRQEAGYASQHEPDWKEDAFYAPNYGQVYVEDRYHDEHGQFFVGHRLTLLSYYLNR
ncbi:MAG: hypothetical protein JSS75_09220 [Bacteroidetes bacterium]|nr:hypothetical protein [Bacteroidota bacterium]